ncbi:glycosyltransferase [Acaryochloris sp. CCMEE 5410]|uniref:glycosyltransferase n=1 Tax=Acaryochloris sp. CCMEE 5410 TaxID=310037 RepID=UPI0002484E4E|nr:glycosyltransferase [Acaryochloris sp. CCMEE 5410]KAI9130463.1 glycosyltransferase [Acaryochloris sp. CCMEE 5410]
MFKNFSQSKRLKIHLLIPNIFGFKGGVQVYSAFFLEALQEIYPFATIDVFLLHDTSQDIASSQVSFLTDTRFHSFGKFKLSFRSWIYAFYLIAYGLFHRPDLIISTHLNFSVVAHRLNQIAGIPFWTIAHGVEAWDITRPDLKNALSKAQKILAVSHYTCDRLIKEQELKSGKISLLHNTFQSKRFQPSPKPDQLLKKHSLHIRQPILLTVCRLCASESYKSYDVVLGALPTILKTIPEAKYFIVGKGDDKSRLEKKIIEMDLQEHVILTGFVPDQDLCDYYNLCDVFVMPSKLEGFGIVYLEALACGKPVIGGNQDGAVDALSKGELGALVDPDDAEEIAETVIQILNRTYPNYLMFQPNKLRSSVIERFGFTSFKRTLRNYLQTEISTLSS